MGDLTNPKLGCSDEQWQFLADTIDDIYHNGMQSKFSIFAILFIPFFIIGALVNGVMPYDAMKKENVSSTVELLKLCCLGDLMTLHYMSTLSTCAVSPTEGVIKEGRAGLIPEHMIDPADGYK